MQGLVCTIITKSYLAHARVLAESIREHNPKLPPLLVLLADRVDGCFDPEQEPFRLVQLEDLADQEAVQQMSFYYTPFEFCCALRGCLHDYVLGHTEAQKWIFLDSDILVLHDLSQIFDQLASHSIVLSPHLWTPDDPGGEVATLHAGIYNAGFLGMGRTEVTRAFAAWFQQRLRWYCLADHPFMFVDQRWLDHVPVFFSEVSLLRDGGANLGHWNLLGRRISRGSQGFVVDGSPIKFVHFSGWDIAVPEKVSRHNPHLDATTCPGWNELAGDYAKRLYQSGYDAVHNFPYAFDSFDDGQPISFQQRRTYYAGLREGTWQGECPFSSRNVFVSLEKNSMPARRRLFQRLKKLSKVMFFEE